MKIKIIIIFLLITSVIISQNKYNVNFLIKDSVIILKKNKNIYKYAVKVNVEINVLNLKDTLLFYKFNKYVGTNIFFSDMVSYLQYKKDGLKYIIEDYNQHIMESEEIIFVSYKNSEVEIKNLNSRDFVTSKSRIKKKLLTFQEQRDYDLAKYAIYDEKQKFVLYPLIGKGHFYLPKGEYYLYFVYSYHNEMQFNSKVFNGSFVSNKVKLIVK